jgi:hypothetical protein
VLAIASEGFVALVGIERLSQACTCYWISIQRPPGDIDADDHHRLTTYVKKVLAVRHAGCLVRVCPQPSASARTRLHEQLPRIGRRLLSDQLSEYRVDDPYMQAHLHGPSSRLVLDLDDHRTSFGRSGQASTVGGGSTATVRDSARHHRHQVSER